jgi:curved DNA-binding protein
VKFKDYYKTLGVPRTASDADIKKAFRKLAREHHPDVAKDKKKAEEKFKEVNEAYEVLGDPAKRKKYDDLGQNWSSGADFRPPPGWESMAGGGPGRRYRSRGPGGEEFEFQFGGTGFSDFFEQLFGSTGRGRPGAARGGFSSHGFGDEDPGAERGQDLEGDILVTLQEVMNGSVRSISVRHREPCPSCGGSGIQSRRPCGQCGGAGQLEKSETYQVKIPAGVSEGQRLRVPGRGQTGAGRSPGDLYLRVRLARHPELDVDGHNLVYEAELAPWEAVLGTKIMIPSLNGPVNIRIPAGTQSGQKLRVRGRGLPDRHGGQGDLIVVTKIEVPKEVSESERKVWEQLAKESRFSPRA